MKNAIISQRATERRPNKQRGASLLEGVAYLGIAAIVILGAVSLLTGAFGSAQSNRATEEIISVRTAVRKLYAGQAYPAAMAPSLIAARAIPATMTVDQANNTITNTFGGNVTIVGAGATFTLTYPSVPQDVCVNLLSGVTGWTQIAVGANNLNAFPVTAAQAAAACAAGANGIAFTAS